MMQLAAAVASLLFDVRMLKVRCCRDARECEYLPLSEAACAEGWRQDHDRRGWECTAQVPCQKLMQALDMMNAGQVNTDLCFQTLLQVQEKMRVDTTGRPTAPGFGHKCASTVRNNLAVATLMRQRNMKGMQRAHRLFTMAVLCDNENAAAVHNLMELGGSSACADMADHGEPGQDKLCEELPGYHLRMLHDHPRNRAYESAIKWALEERPGARVLDIGAGSGLLSFVAAKHGAQRVDALEMILPVAAAARANVAANGLNDIVHVWPVKSHNFPEDALPASEHASYRPDVIVHEIFDPCMLGEGVLPAMRDLVQRLATPTTLILPHVARAMVQGVASSELASHRWPPRNHPSLPIDYSLVEAYASAMFKGDAPIIETHNMRSTYALTEPVAVLELDLYALPAGGGRRDFLLPVTAAGRLSALTLSFEAEFGDGGRIASGANISGMSPPGDIPSHWAQQVFLLGDGWQVWPHDRLAFTVIWNDWAIQLVDVRIEERGEGGRKLRSLPAYQAWHLPRQMLGPHFTCFTGTKAQILTPDEVQLVRWKERRAGGRAGMLRQLMRRSTPWPRLKKLQQPRSGSG